MSKQLKLALTIVLGVAGIGLAVWLFGPASMPFWAEISKWAPGIVISAFALFAAQDSRDTAKRGEDEARAGRETAERGEQEARAVRERNEAAMSKRQRKRADKAAPRA
jgi:hypothetical protein